MKKELYLILYSTSQTALSEFDLGTLNLQQTVVCMQTQLALMVPHFNSRQRILIKRIPPLPGVVQSPINMPSFENGATCPQCL